MNIGRCNTIDWNNITDSIKRLFINDINTTQVYLPTDFRKLDKLVSMDLTEEKRLLNNFGINMIIHGNLMYNFCNSRISKGNMLSLGKELIIANKLGCKGVIIHQGKNTNSLAIDEAIKLYTTNINNVLDKTKNLNTHIILENSTGQGSEIGYTISELYKIYSMIKDEYKHKISFCIDTCHLFASGEIDLSNIGETTKFVSKFKELFKLDKLSVIHLNDSKGEFGCKKDRHDNLCNGFIFKSKKSLISIKPLIEVAKAYNIPIICETPIIKGISNQLCIEWKLIEHI